MELQVESSTGEALTFPVMARQPARAQLLRYRTSVTKGRPWSAPPHERIVLDPYDGRILERAPVAASSFGTVDGAPLGKSRFDSVDSDTYFENVDVFDSLAPRVWTAFLEEERPDAGLRSDLVRYCEAWSVIARPEHLSYYAVLGRDFDAWIATVAGR